jgi:hypothetical protein
MKDTALTAIADRTILKSLNQSLVDKAAQQRKKRTAKHFGDRILTVEDIQARTEERQPEKQKSLWLRQEGWL